MMASVSTKDDIAPKMKHAKQFHFSAIMVFVHLLFGLNASAQGVSDVIILPWTERVPFQYINSDGKLAGILYDLGEKIFKKAELAVKWQEVPANRILLMLERNDERVCLVGWYKTPAREAVSNISSEIYRDKPLRGVLRSDSKYKNLPSLKSLSADTGIELLFKQGYSYGAIVDELIASRSEKHIQRVTGNNSTILKMITLYRADLTFLPQEEIDAHREVDASFDVNFSVVKFAELKEGNTRHIVCSKNVALETIAKLDKEIQTTLRNK